MNNLKLKEEIREFYGKIARESDSCCSSCCGTGEETSVQEGVSYEGRDRNVVETSNLGLGCGDPTRFSGIENGMTVLDLGSGGGIDVFLASAEVGPNGRVIGLDMTDEMLERAEQNRQKLDVKNVVFLKGEIESIPLPADSVDRVISNCVINLVPNKEKAFLEINRILKPGGSFVVSDVVTEGHVSDEHRQNADLWAGCVAGAVDKLEYLETIRKAGFADVGYLTEGPVNDLDDLQFGIRSVTATGIKVRKESRI